MSSYNNDVNRMLIEAAVLDEVTKDKLDQSTLEQLNVTLHTLELNNGTEEAKQYIRNLIRNKENEIAIKEKNRTKLLIGILIAIAIGVIVLIIINACITAESNSFTDTMWCPRCNKMVTTHGGLKYICDICGKSIC